MTITRMTPKDRKADILKAAVVVASRVGFTAMRQQHIVDEAKCSYGLMTRYYTMTNIKRAVMRVAIEDRNIPIIAAGLGCGDPTARKAPADLKAKALAHLAK